MFHYSPDSSTLTVIDDYGTRHDNGVLIPGVFEYFTYLEDGTVAYRNGNTLYAGGRTYTPLIKAVRMCLEPVSALTAPTDWSE